MRQRRREAEASGWIIRYDESRYAKLLEETDKMLERDDKMQDNKDG